LPVFIAVLALCIIVYVLRPTERRKATSAAASTPEPESTDVTVTPATTPPTTGPTIVQLPATGANSNAPRRLLATDPDPIPSVRHPAVNGKDFDPFEVGFLGPDPVRTLATVGVVRVGIPKSAVVRDEKQVTQILTDLATEIDAKEKGRTDDTHHRAEEYNALMVEYGQRLRPFMSGSFAFHADKWALYGTVPTDAGDAGT
jgi:hypothetical protein